ncbi:glucosaminidase domain-containing protein [Cohnella sp. GCM10020058]|uniref:glucosaminidase domain-containing protein n=1 Tax=Cohnella sp. GCM10020058 TaxID=3317330 RepID=UPI003643DAD5
MDWRHPEEYRGKLTSSGSGGSYGALGGVLKGTGDLFQAAAKKYGIDARLLTAIAMHETGNGTSSAAKNKYNVGGMMGRNGLMSFDSLAAGIDAMASNLKRLYYDQGLTTIEQIQRKYAPVGAANDPTGLNKNWISGVSKYLSMLGG